MCMQNLCTLSLEHTRGKHCTCFNGNCTLESCHTRPRALQSVRVGSMVCIVLSSSDGAIWIQGLARNSYDTCARKDFMHFDTKSACRDTGCKIQHNRHTYTTQPQFGMQDSTQPQDGIHDTTQQQHVYNNTAMWDVWHSTTAMWDAWHKTATMRAQHISTTGYKTQHTHCNTWRMLR